MRNQPRTQRACVQFAPTVSLSVRFLLGRLTPRGLRRRFIDTLKAEIARAGIAGEIDIPVAEELHRALPARDRA
jgi:hypothetical protein